MRARGNVPPDGSLQAKNIYGLGFETYEVVSGRVNLLVLLYTPEYKLGDRVERVLRTSRFQVVRTASREEAHSIIQDFELSLVVAAVGGCQPEIVGLVKGFRTRAPRLPLVLLPFPESNSSKIECLNSGADDVLSCDLEAQEVVARLNAVIRRSWSRRVCAQSRNFVHEFRKPNRECRWFSNQIDPLGK